MKKNSIIHYFMLISSILLLASCKQDDAIIESQDGTIIESNGADYRIEEFKSKGNLWTPDEMLEIKKQGNIASSPDNPVVPLVVTKDLKKVLSKSSYQKLLRDIMKDGQNIVHEDFYFTDLKTYRSVVDDEYAKPSYALEAEDGSYIYDAYREHRYTRDKLSSLASKEYERKKMQSRNVSGKSSPEFVLNKADILVGKWTIGNKFGHACVVAGTGCTTTVPNTKLQCTTTFDAWGSMENPQEDIGFRNGCTYWCSDYIQWRAVVRLPGITQAQRDNILYYSVLQDDDTYSLWTPLWNESKWYCSKLVWRAYWSVGVDISNGRHELGVVVPEDFVINPNLDVTYY